MLKLFSLLSVSRMIMNTSKNYEFCASYFPNLPIIYVKIGCLLVKITSDRFSNLVH